MTNLDVYMEALRDEMQQRYFDGDILEALALSRRLDQIIALKQRERESGSVIVPVPQLFSINQ
jgi:predicted amidophosphoribosyltransferase